MLSVSPKQALNSLIKSSKLLSKSDSFSRSGANHAKAELLSNVPIQCRKNTTEIRELEAGPRGLRLEDIRFMLLVNLRNNGDKKV